VQDDNKRIEKLLEENLLISKENNKLLLGMRRGQRVAFWMRVFYFLVVTGFIFGAFYVVAPFIKSTLEIYQNLPHTLPDIFDYVPYLRDIKDVLPEGGTAQ